MSPSPASSSGVTSSLDLTARTFDLLGSLVKASEPTSVITQAAKDLIKWLARERIDEASFKKCAELARELAYPNQHGLIIRESIEHANERLRGLNAPISLITSGSLGRMMVHDQDYCYLVSTVASLASYYGNEHITDIICSLIIDRTDALPGIRQHKHYQIYRAPIAAVMSKIVDSIFLNVINAGHQPPHIPPQLSDLHPHALGHWELPALIRGIQEADGDVLIVCGVFFADVFAWLFSHFHGHLKVSVRGIVSYTEHLGPDQKGVHLMVQEVCNDTDDCLQKKHVFEASVAAGDGSYRLFVGKSSKEGPFSESARPQPHVRQPLYHESAVESNRRYTGRVAKLNRTEKNHVTAVAKSILKWLLALQLESWGATLVFAPTWDEKGGVTCLAEMLSVHPSLLQKDTGHFESTAPVFTRTQEQPEDDSDGNSSSDMGPGEAYRLSAVFSCFPVVLDMLESISKRCSCSACERHLSLDECKSGCLRDLAITELFILLAHAISEGFGAVDVSGLAKPDDVVGSMFEVFHQLIFRNLLQWSDWFSVVTIVTAGIPYRIFTESGPSFGGTQPVAMQNGAYVAVVPWASLSREIQLAGCFSLEFYEGCIEGISEETAMMRCERASEGNGDDESAKVFTGDEDEDDSKLSLSTAIFREGDSVYRLMTLVSTGVIMRVFDPTEALECLFNSRFPLCSCTSNPNPQEKEAETAVRLYGFENILEDWSLMTPRTDIQVTRILSDRLKVNVALALSGAGVVMTDVRSCCFECALKELRKEPRAIGPERIIRTRLHERALAS